MVVWSSTSAETSIASWFWINYPYRVVYIRFMGTHAQYDAIDAQTV
jgi:mRNA-degrading endonuclease HigB of HigAB toxin-antitoxin module